MAMTWQRNLASANTTTVSNENCFVSSSHITNAFLSFQDMRMKEENCDIFICIHGQRFPAHRVVLAGTCKFFREKLVAKQVDEEEKPPHFKELEIPEHFEKQIVHSVLDFFVHGKTGFEFSSNERYATTSLLPSGKVFFNNFRPLLCVNQNWLTRRVQW